MPTRDIQLGKKVDEFWFWFCNKLSFINELQAKLNIKAILILTSVLLLYYAALICDNYNVCCFVVLKLLFFLTQNNLTNIALVVMPAIVSEEDKPDFVTPGVVNNPVGWGPISIPEQFRDIPYQPFSKSDNLGQVGFQVHTTTQVLSTCVQ